MLVAFFVEKPESQRLEGVSSSSERFLYEDSFSFYMTIGELIGVGAGVTLAYVGMNTKGYYNAKNFYVQTQAQHLAQGHTSYEDKEKVLREPKVFVSMGIEVEHYERDVFERTLSAGWRLAQRRFEAGKFDKLVEKLSSELKR